MNKYGVASKYDFDNPLKWVTQASVPLLDEHTMVNDRGQPVATVDRRALEQIAANNNRRVRETGDPATLILGHTSDDPSAPEKPSKGFVVNYTVKPYKRDPQTGRVVYAIHGDFKVRPRNATVLEDFPRRSVELWWHKKELDPVALLGGTSPERDLSVVIRNARLNHVALDSKRHPNPGVRDFEGRETPCVQFSVRGNRTVEWYEIEDAPVRRQRQETRMPRQQPQRYNQRCAPARYEADDELNDFDAGAPDDDLANEDPDFGGSPEPGDVDDGDDDPVVAKVMQSKWAKGIDEKLNMILAALEGGGEGGTPPGPGGDEMPPEEMPPPAPPGAPDGMGADLPPDGMDDSDPDDTPLDPDEESRRAQGGNPVQFSQVTNMAGPRNTAIPTTGGKRYARPAGRQQQPKSENAVLRREVHEMKFKLARMEAEKAISALEAEGVIFGDTPQASEQAKGEQTDYCAYLYMRSQEDFDHEVNVMRTRYKRRKPNPANPVQPGVARYARNGVAPAPAESDEDYEPTNPMEATAFADAQVQGMSRTDAIKFMRKNRERFAKYDDDVNQEQM